MTRFRIREATGEIVGGLILLAIGVVWAVGAGDYGLLGEGGRLAPGTVPFVCGTALAITGTFIAAKALLSSRRAESEPLEARDSESPASTVAGADQTAPAAAGGRTTVALMGPTLSVGSRLRLLPTAYPVLTVFLLLAAGLLMMPLLGFSVSFALLIFAILHLVERQRIRTSLLVGVVTALFGFILFEVLFNLPLPEPFFL